MRLSPISSPVMAVGIDNWRLSRRSWLAAMLLLGATQSAHAAPAGSLPLAQSLRDELAEAVKGGNPLLVLVSLDGCPFCKMVRENYLIPLRQQQGLPIVQVDMHSAAAVMDVDGKPQTHDALLRLWDIRMAPTVLFFGQRGAEVAPRLVGIASPDYYGAYLDARLTQARAALKNT